MGKVVINYKVEKEEWVKAVDKAFEKLNKKTKIDGFREGKVPRNIFEKKYGVENLYIEAGDSLIHERYHKLFSEDKVEPIVEPKVDVVKMDENGMEVNFTIITKPEVQLGEYKKLGVKKEEVKVSKKEIEESIAKLKDKYAEIVSVDRKVKNGDVAIIDFEGFKDGVPFEGGKATNYSLEIGSNSFIPGFEEGIIGMAKEEEKDLNLKFPENYQAEELKGKEVVFKVKLHDVKERVIPEINEDFFEDLAIEGVKNITDLEAHVTNDIKEHKEYDADNKFIDELLKKAASNMKVEIDDEIILDEENRMYNQFMDRMAYQGLNEELYLQYANTTKEELLKQMKPEAENRVKERYLLESIAKEENINVTDEEANVEADNMSKKYGMTKDELIKAFGGLDVVIYDLKMKKAIELIKENN